MERRRKKKLEGRKRKMEWRVWKRKVIVSLQLRILLALELFDFSFLNIIFPSICG